MRKSMLITSIIIILISSLVMNVSAENLTELSTNDLFIKYPYYLNNAETNDIIRNATDTYNNVMSDYDENDEFISAIKSGVSSSVEVIIRDIGSKLGLMDSYYETCMDTATIELMQTLYSDENLIAGMDVVKKTSEILEDVRTISEITTVKSCEIAAALENLSESDVLAMTEELVENSGDILDSVEDAANMAKYIYTACIITDVQLEMIDVLMERVDKNGELYEGLSRLRQTMSYNIVEYTSLTFIKNKGLAYISETVTKLGLNAFGISTGPFLIGQIIAKTAVWVMFDIIYPHPGADEVISNMIHSMYVMELETSLMNQRLAFNSPFYVSDMEAYETYFTVYLSAVKTTLESTKALAEEEYIKQRLETAKQNLASALPNYEAYINKCKKEVLSIAETDRIMRPTDQTMYTSGTTVIGDPGELINYRIIPVPSEGTTYWNMNVGGDLTVNTPVTFPMLTLNGMLDVNSDIIVNGSLENRGTLKMGQDTDYILVKGKYEHIRSVTSEYITAGILEIKGDISGGGYKPSETHKTILSGTSSQSVDMYSHTYSGEAGHFNILELANTSEDGITFEWQADIYKELSSNGGKVINGRKIYLRENAKIRENVLNIDITLYNWTDSSSIDFNGITYLSGTNLFNYPHEINKLYMEEVNDVLIVKNNLHIKKDFVQRGTLELNGCSLTLDGVYAISGVLKMQNKNDYVLVKGKYEHGSFVTSEYITAGILEIKGDVNGGGYKPSGTHKTILSGTSSQSVDMYSHTYGGGYGHFNILELANTSEMGVSFSDRTYVKKELYSNNANIVNGRNIYITETATIRNGYWNADLTAYNWTCNETCTITGSLYVEKDTIINSDVVIKERLNLDDTLENTGCLLKICGDFSNNGILKMSTDNSHIIVEGRYYQQERNTSDYIIAGILEVKGDVLGYYSPTGSHKTLLSGTGKQNVNINVGLDYGHFNVLEIANTSEEGINFTASDITKVLVDILQPVGTKIANGYRVKLQNKPAFVDYGELNAEINKFNGNAENVIPTWLDYERYCKIAFDRDKVIIINESITDTAFTCDLYFSNDYDKSSATVIIAFYDGDNRLVQMASKPVDVKVGKIDVSIDYANKPYSTYKIMVWESLGNLKPLMAVK